MQRLIGRLMAAILIVGVGGFAGSILPGPNDSMAAGPMPVVSVGTPLIKMSDCKGIVIMGTGFRPGQEIHLLFTTSDGQQSDIGYALKPAPKPDKTGSWSTTWNAGQFVAKKLVTGGAHRLSVVDSEYRGIAHTVVFFQPEPQKKPEDKPKDKK